MDFTQKLHLTTATMSTPVPSTRVQNSSPAAPSTARPASGGNKNSPPRPTSMPSGGNTGASAQKQTVEPKTPEKGTGGVPVVPSGISLADVVDQSDGEEDNNDGGDNDKSDQDSVSEVSEAGEVPEHRLIYESDYVMVYLAPFGTETVINSSGIITAENLSQMNFAVFHPEEITGSIESSRNRGEQGSSSRVCTPQPMDKQVAYTKTEAIYLDNSRSTTMAIKDCVIIRSDPKVAPKSGQPSTYSATYTCISIPIDKIMNSGTRSGLEVAYKPRTGQDAEYAWVNSSPITGPFKAVTRILEWL